MTSANNNKPPELYKRVTAIDIGSTNSQIAQCYQTSNDGGKTWEIALDKQKDAKECLLMDNGSFDIPTIIVKKDDMPAALSGQINFGKKDFFAGKDADNIFHTYQGIAARVEFKRDFFCSNEELSDADNKEKFERAKESMKILLSYLKGIKDYAQDYFKDKKVEDETIVTVPLRATDFERNTMRNLAEEVGFQNVQIRDEASAVLRYALMAPESQLRPRLEEGTLLQKLSVLIVDVGGSTTDILLVDIKPDEQGGFKVDEIGRWPKIGEKNTLGGIDIDKKICEWFKDKNYVLPALLETSIKNHGYKIFREFKEHSSYGLNENADIILGGNIENLAFDKKTKNFATNYPDNGKFDADAYLNEIAGEYLPDICAAIRAVLSDCGVEEENIDCVIASGGGAKMFGLAQLLKGEKLPTIAKPLRFAKVQANPKMYIENKDFSSALCAIGSAWPLPKISFKNACPCEYFFKINIYRTNKDKAKAWEKDNTFNIALPDMSGYEVPATFKELEVVFAKKNAPLPIKNIYRYDVKDLLVADGQVFIILLSLWSRADDGSVHFQKGWSTCSSRTWGNAIKQFAKKVGNALSPFTTSFFTIIIGDKIKIFKEYENVKATFIVTTEVTEDFMIKLTPDFDIEGQTDLNKSTLTAN